jgi:thiamine monophosphate synthase
MHPVWDMGMVLSDIFGNGSNKAMENSSRRDRTDARMEGRDSERCETEGRETEGRDSERRKTEGRKTEGRKTPPYRLALHVLIDPEWSCTRDILTVASAAIEGGATVIQLRDKKASTRLLVEQGLALRKLTYERGVLFIVNDRVDVALAVDADGVHIGQDDDMPLQIARRLVLQYPQTDRGDNQNLLPLPASPDANDSNSIVSEMSKCNWTGARHSPDDFALRPRRILGVSVGNMEEAMNAVAADADYLSVGPIFSTYAKPNAGPAIGTSMLAELAARYQIPIIGIGGITAQNAGEVLQAGAVGVAVITAVISAEDIVAAAREIAVKMSVCKG